MDIVLDRVAHPLSHRPRKLRGMTEEFAHYLLMAALAIVAIGCALWLVSNLLKVMLPGSDAPDSN